MFFKPKHLTKRATRRKILSNLVKYLTGPILVRVIHNGLYILPSPEQLDRLSATVRLYRRAVMSSGGVLLTCSLAARAPERKDPRAALLRPGARG
jgi:hypothetical protein